MATILKYDTTCQYSADLEDGFKRFAFFKGSIVDGIWHCNVDHFGQNDTVSTTLVKLTVYVWVDGYQTQALTVSVTL